MKKTALTLFLLTLAGMVVTATETSPIQLDNGGRCLMNTYLNGFLFSPMHTRYCIRDFQNGTTGKHLKIQPNNDFKDYDAVEGDVVTLGNRFWLLGGSGTVNNKRWQPTDTILTATVSPEGALADLKRIQPLPYKDKHLRALIHQNRLYVLGGIRHSDLNVADLQADGTLSPWKALPAFPNVVAQGGFVFYKGCLYANGRSTWRPGSSKLFALKLKEDGTALSKWERVDSPENAQGFMTVHNDALYYFDTLSGTIYKTTQMEDDAVQLNDWTPAGTMPCPPKTEGVQVVNVPGGWLFCGGALPKTQDGKFAGFFKAAFMPFSAVK